MAARTGWMKEGEISEANEKAVPSLEEGNRRDMVQEDKGKRTGHGRVRSAKCLRNQEDRDQNGLLGFLAGSWAILDRHFLLLLLAYVSVMVRGVTEEKLYFSFSSE